MGWTNTGAANTGGVCPVHGAYSGYCCASCAIGDTNGAAIARPPFLLPLADAGAAVPAWPLRQRALGVHEGR